MKKGFEIDYQTIFKGLNHRKIDYLVAGGVAVNFHGIPRMTYALDLMVLLEEKNIHRTVSILLEWGYKPRAPVNPFELAEEKKRAAVFVVEGEEVPVVSIRDLIELKLHAKRRQDLSDVLHLRSILEE